jgi:DNA-binding MarR family transcriptional regulator
MTAYPIGWNAAELMRTDFPEPRWAVEGIIPEGLTVIAGPPKIGKSWFSLNIAVAVTSGGRALGRIPVEQGDGCYLALEDVGRRLKDRVGIVLEGHAAPERLHFFPTWPLLHDGGADLLDCWLSEHPACRIVVVDVYARVKGVTDHREDRYQADYRQVSRLKEIADRWAVPVLVVHHTRKQASEDALDLVSGTTGLTGAADAVLVLRRSRGSADANLFVTGRDVEEKEYPLKLQGGRWSLLDGEARDYEVSDQRRRILNILRSRPGLTPKSISAATGLDHSVVKHLVRRMADSGDLATAGDGTYSPPIHSVHPVHPDLINGERSEQGERVTDPQDELELLLNGDVA